MEADQIQRVLNGVQSFAADMKEQGIHVGLGKDPRCVTCGEPWPCSREVASRSGEQT